MGKGGMGECSGGAALFQLKNVRSHTGKIELLEELMTNCAKKTSKTSRKANKVKGEKKQMSGYNCYMKVCAKKSGNFGKCLTDKGWGKLSDDVKASYNKKALEGCPI
ncbi:hypothetical protein LCGC14_0223240 [marine sediment metagenome]|uniref:Uncharacterized protein n=1 Tax=marine sediment metagenome TaxID=412755 RepID=A0A0F9WWF3_9ZZZZ